MLYDVMMEILALVLLFVMIFIIGAEFLYIFFEFKRFCRYCGIKIKIWIEGL